MTRLTSVQEAAFNAAGEALVDLGIKIVVSYTPPLSDGVERFYAFADHPHKKNGYGGAATVFGAAAPTAAEGVQNLLDKLEAAESEPPSLATPGEVVTAVKDFVGTRDHIPAGELLDALDALPLASS